jgi:glycosyltransferase involved in cell wall biosynthesis
MGGTSKFVEMAICHLVRRFDVVIVRGQQARKFVEERNISRNCVVLTGAIELADYQVTSYNDRKTDLIYVCRLVKEVKGLEPFLNMLRELVRERNSLSVMIVGDGPDREYFEGLARAYDLESCVAFVGQCNSVPKLLMQAKVFCLLSPSEGMSIAMLEAMAAGVPVVVTDVGELGDAVKGHGSGILIRHESAAETAKLVGTLLDDLQLWGNCSSAARKVIEDSFSVESITAIWNRVFTGMGHRHALPYRACRRDRAS